MPIENNENYLGGRVAFRAGNTEEALRCFRLACEEDPDPLGYRALGNCLMMRKEFAEADTAYQTALQLEPSNGENDFLLANAKFLQKQFRAAFDLYRAALSKSPGAEVTSQVYHQLSLLCSARKDVRGALFYLEQFEKADPTGNVSLDEDIMAQRIQLYLLSGDLKKAADYTDQLVMAHPTNWRNYRAAFSVAMANEDYKRAAALLENAGQAVSGENESTDLAIQKTALLVTQAQADPTQAQAYYNQALTVLNEQLHYPELSVIHINELLLCSAEVYLAAGEKTFAEDFVKRIKDSADSAAIYQLPEPAPHAPIDYNSFYQAAVAGTDRIRREMDAGKISDQPGGWQQIQSALNSMTPMQPKPEQPLPLILPAVFEDRRNYILLTCAFDSGRYEESIAYAKRLRLSETPYYSYLGRYSEASAAKQLGASAFSEKDIQMKYDETIAFFKGQMLRDAGDLYAVVFRARLYAENGDPEHAQRLASLLPPSMAEPLLEYIGSYA